MSEHGGLLAIITDINLEYWNRKDSMDFNTMISSVLLYINSYFLLHRENRLVWLISFASGSEIVFPTNGKDVFLDTKAEAFHSVQKNVLERIQVQMKSASEMSAANATSGMASAFSRGLCCTYKMYIYIMYKTDVNSCASIASGVCWAETSCSIFCAKGLFGHLGHVHFYDEQYLFVSKVEYSN